jgi:hypothetical protein
MEVSSPLDLIPPRSSENVARIASGPTARTLTDLNLPPLPEMESLAQADPEWFADPAQRRDEGVLAGLAGAEMEPYLQAIRAFFQAQIARANSAVTSFDELLKAIENASDRLTEQAASDPDSRLNSAIALPAATLVLSLASSIALTVMVEGLLDGAFTDSWFVAVAVTVTGLTSVVRRSAWLFASTRAVSVENGEADRWKLIAIEFGLPLVAAGFVVAWSPDPQTIPRAVTLAAFLFLAFVFVGKLMLRAIAGAEDWNEARRSVGKTRQQGSLLQELHRYRIEVLQRKARAISPERLEHDSDAAVSLFRSEYELAKAHVAGVPYPRSQQ